MFEFLRPRKRSRTTTSNSLTPKQLVKSAAQVHDPFTEYNIPRTLSLPSKQSTNLRWILGPHVQADDLEWMITCIENSLKELYKNSLMKWDREEKVNEMKHKNQRILIVQNDNVQKNGFLTFRWDTEEQRAVMYVYELYVSTQVRGLGYAQAMMRLAEELCKAHHVEEIMLTVFNCNQAAMKLYCEKLGYQIDETSPSKYEIEDAGYEILSKKIINVDE